MKRHPGVVVATVKSLDDPRGEGRIQIEFPWLPDITEHPWAPIAAPLAGGERGMFFMPEPKDEVLVAFEHGDFDHPFVVGFLWNGVDRPPESDTHNRVIVTPGGTRYASKTVTMPRKSSSDQAADTRSCWTIPRPVRRLL